MPVRPGRAGRECHGSTPVRAVAALEATLPSLSPSCSPALSLLLHTNFKTLKSFIKSMVFLRRNHMLCVQPSQKGKCSATDNDIQTHPQ
jgi:hypothetical protein